MLSATRTKLRIDPAASGNPGALPRNGILRNCNQTGAEVILPRACFNADALYDRHPGALVPFRAPYPQIEREYGSTSLVEPGGIVSESAQSPQILNSGESSQ